LAKIVARLDLFAQMPVAATISSYIAPWAAIWKAWTTRGATSGSGVQRTRVSGVPS
jgi:hypothetical protein